MPAEKKNALFPILTVTFISTLGYSIIIPFLVYLVEKFGGNAVIYGIIGASYPAFQLIGAPILGRWSDIYGRKRVLVLSQIGTLLGWILFLSAFYFPADPLLSIDSALLGAFILTVPLIIIFLARAIDGLTGGNISVANAYLADISDDKSRKTNFGKLSVASNLGFIVGPALAGVLGATALKEVLPVMAAIVISAAALVVIIVMLPESKPAGSDHPDTEETTAMRKFTGIEHKDCVKHPDPKEKSKISFRSVLKIEGIPKLYILYFLIFLAFNVFYTAFPVHALETLKWNVTEMGVFFSVLSALMILVQGPVLSRLSKKFTDEALVTAGNILLAVNFLMLLSGNVIIIYGAAAMFAAGNGLMWPSFLSVLAKTGGRKHQGAVQGLAGSVGGLASIAGLVFGGIIYSKLGVSTFIIPAVIIFLVFVISLGFKKKPRIKDGLPENII